MRKMRTILFLFLLPDRKLRDNRLNGTLTIGYSYGRGLQLVDLQNNSIRLFTQKAGGYGIQIV